LALALAVVWLFGGSLRCAAQEARCISVRVLDAKSGKPIKGLLVYVATRSDHLGDYKPIGKTDAQGVARFCPKDPVPTSFLLDFKYFEQMDPGGEVDTKCILEKGSVAGNAYNKGKFHNRESPKPGEMVVFGRRWWWIDRLSGEWP
jgi:hypothetical protein